FFFFFFFFLFFFFFFFFFVFFFFFFFFFTTGGGGPHGRRPPHPGGTFLRPRSAYASSWDATARRASASSTPQLISCSVRTDGDWS
ncbi:hypothetical protein ACWEPD_21475, partial [Streptomyces pseudogriseolus]